MSVGQNILEVLRRNLTNSNYVMKGMICNMSKMKRSLLSDTVSEIYFVTLVYKQIV